VGWDFLDVDNRSKTIIALGGAGHVRTLRRIQRIRKRVTPLAACGLVIIIAVATVYALVGGGGATALMPLVVGLLPMSVAFGRWVRVVAV
jgi:hypothetical protein